MSVADRVISPQTSSHPNPQICDCVRLHSKVGLLIRMQMELRLLIQDNKKIILDYLGGPSVITRIFKSGKKRQKRDRGKYDFTRSERCSVAGFEDRGRGPTSKDTGGL